MLQFRPMDTQVPIFNQLGEDLAPIILIKVFTVDATDVAALVKAWDDDANWMKRQAGYISTQLHRGIAGSCVFLNYAVWGIGGALSCGVHASRVSKRTGCIALKRGGLASLVQQSRCAQPLYCLTWHIEDFFFIGQQLFHAGAQPAP